jgi:hypothetical protein
LDRMPRHFRRCFSRSKPDLLMVRREVGLRAASSRETSRLIADPLNCMLGFNVIFRFLVTNFDFSRYTNKLEENFSVIIIANAFSMGCSVHPSARPHRSSDAKPEWNTI